MHSMKSLQTQSRTACAPTIRPTTLSRLGKSLLLLGVLTAATTAAAPSSAQVLASEISAINYTAAGKPVVNSFVMDNYLRLWEYANVATSSAKYVYLGYPAAGISGDTGPSAVTYLNGRTQNQYVFVTGANGHLFVCYYNGKWQWVDQGAPATKVKAQGFPSALLYQDTAGVHIHAFVVGSDGNLYDNNWTGTKWVWTKLGDGGASLQALSATTYVYNGVRKIYVFASTQQGDLYTCYMVNNQWSWANQGNPDAGFLFQPQLGPPSTLSFVTSSGQYIYTFTAGSDGALYLNYWDGAWHWVNQGSVGNGAVSPQAISYNDGAGTKIYCFVNGGTDLYVNYWNSGWHWADQGAPPSAYPTSALTFNVGGVREIFAFAAGGPRDAVCNYWNGTQWDWLTFPAL